MSATDSPASSASAYHPDTSSPFDLLLGSSDRVPGEWRAVVQREPWGALPDRRRGRPTRP